MMGAGNVATHLSLALKQKGFIIQQVYNRTIQSASELAAMLKTDYTHQLSEVNTESDLIIFAISDSAIEEVLAKLSLQNNFLVHCSGSTPLNVLKGFSEKIAVLYPLQTFSKNRQIDFNEVPLFVEANNIENEKVIEEFAQILSSNVRVLDSNKRLTLHISAVFACNFANHCFTLASKVLNSEDIPFDVLHPLINETALKVNKMEPFDAQTGPAVRFDENIIGKHMQFLSNSTGYAELYQLISESIYKIHKKTCN
jgi:predicted short-subunit dehydrogenase-like oxidoreductase (DUF2520 family)